MRFRAHARADRSTCRMESPEDQEVRARTPYPATFRMLVGAAQTDPVGPEVVSEYRYFFLNPFPFPYSEQDVGHDGPEDIRREDDLIRNFAVEATPESPRHSEGDIVELKDGSLLLVWTDYFAGEGWDRSPARLSAKVSKDGGRSWGEPWTAVEYDAESPAGNVMSASLIRATNGDILMAYHGELSSMQEEGTLLRRSSDEGRTWNQARRISPDSENVHAASNACFRRLRGGRIVLSSREYINGIRWPYALYSDDDGATWIAGQRVPAPDLVPKQVQAQNVNEPTIAELSDGRLLMMMRSVAGGHFFSYSNDEGETWSKPFMSPLRGLVAPGYIDTIPSTGDTLAIWSRGLTGRTPLNSAVSRDGGKTWSPVKLLDRSEYYGYGYTSVDFVDERVVITTMRYPLFSSIERFRGSAGLFRFAAAVIADRMVLSFTPRFLAWIRTSTRASRLTVTPCPKRGTARAKASQASSSTAGLKQKRSVNSRFLDPLVSPEVPSRTEHAAVPRTHRRRRDETV